ncbi:MAG: hypothetical protein ACI9W4_000868 [Rhodothermales bacterium]|jgi:hypothetical protein
MEENGEQEYTLGVAATQPGIYTLTWPDWHEIPEEWSVTLYDREDGRRVDLRQEEAFVFSVGEEHTSFRALGDVAEIDAIPRFNVRIRADGIDVPAPEALPEEFALGPNYPNPFNPVTTIRFALPEAANVRLEVYDTLGRRVAELVNGAEDAGWKEVPWDAENLPSGLYIYRIVTGNTTATRTMMLVR